MAQLAPRRRRYIATALGLSADVPQGRPAICKVPRLSLTSLNRRHGGGAMNQRSDGITAGCERSAHGTGAGGFRNGG